MRGGCYLKKYTVGVLGNSALLVELLLRSGIEEIRVASERVSVEESKIDPLIPESMIGETLESFCFSKPERVRVFEDIVEASKSCDILIDCGFREEGAKMAKRLGIPYVTEPEVTVHLPEGLSYEELQFSERVSSALEYGMIRLLQVSETIRCLKGGELPVLSPEALKVDGERGEIKRVSLLRGSSGVL
ncbi:MAG: hypothetical protein PWR13_57 [Archaeoglobi archaeon]|nr:hypothetical protein [Archaeoglobi archaeon]MDK2781029.1 hypothetical protein [Archaeoglobi archaeon]